MLFKETTCVIAVLYTNQLFLIWHPDRSSSWSFVDIKHYVTFLWLCTFLLLGSDAYTIDTCGTTYRIAFSDLYVQVWFDCRWEMVAQQGYILLPHIVRILSMEWTRYETESEGSPSGYFGCLDKTGGSNTTVSRLGSKASQSALHRICGTQDTSHSSSLGRDALQFCRDKDET